MLIEMKSPSEPRVRDREFQRLLEGFARKYIWWQSEDIAMQRPNYIIARVMDIGDYDDVQLLTAHVTKQHLQEILQGAEIGQFNERSWSYWHYRLGLSASEPVPPMPRRRLG